MLKGDIKHEHKVADSSHKESSEIDQEISRAYENVLRLVSSIDAFLTKSSLTAKVGQASVASLTTLRSEIVAWVSSNTTATLEQISKAGNGFISTLKTLVAPAYIASETEEKGGDVAEEDDESEEESESESESESDEDMDLD